MIHAKRAPHTALFFAWRQHEMVKDELFAFVEEDDEGDFCSLLGVEFEAGGVG